MAFGEYDIIDVTHNHMFPILFSIGPVHIYSFSVFLVLAWLVFSFLFWKLLRSNGTPEDKIFDLTFYATIVASISARGLFVVLHWELFRDTLLKIVALWVQPGLSLYGAFLGGIMTLVSMSRSWKVRLGQVLDAIAIAFPSALVIGYIGSFLDGAEVGKIVDLPWAIRYVGQVGRRHPVQIYEIIVTIIILAVVLVLQNKSVKEKWPYGLLGIWFFILYSLGMFVLEFMKDSHVYWMSLSANQWILIGVFAEALGAFYVRGGGKESVRQIFRSLQQKLKR